MTDLFGAGEDLGTEPIAEPSVAVLLDVDTEYRRDVTKGCLPRLAPRRFSRSGKAWRPVLHTRRGPWRFTVLYSNSALAHRLRRTRDWVVIYFRRNDGHEGHRTVVTETRGALEGRRVVRGREDEVPSPAPATERARAS